MKKKAMMFLLDGISNDKIIRVIDKYSGEVADSIVPNIRDWIETLDKSFGDDCDFILNNENISLSKNSIIAIMQALDIKFNKECDTEDDRRLIVELYFQADDELKEKIYGWFHWLLKDLI